MAIIRILTYLATGAIAFYLGQQIGRSQAAREELNSWKHQQISNPETDKHQSRQD